MVCHIGGQLGTEEFFSALRMLALYMRFNGTGVWGGETLCVNISTWIFVVLRLYLNDIIFIFQVYYMCLVVILLLLFSDIINK